MNSAAVGHSAMTSTYAVPKRFGMAGILAITTFMAVLFGILRSFDCHPIVYVVLGVLALVTCLVQMRYGDVPRMASMASGAVVLPLTAVVAALLMPSVRGVPGGMELAMTLICASPFLAAAGAFFGYLAGAMTAGVFLLMDLVEPHLPGGGKTGPRYAEQIAKQRKQEEIVTATLVDELPPLPGEK